MTILIFSDTHLTKKFDQRKFEFLKKIISSADKVIINGDFWDGWFTSFDAFVNSTWNELFPLLLDKQTVYLYGNHDPAYNCDDRVSLFSIKTAESYDLTSSETTFHIEHGHKISKGHRAKIFEIYGLFLDSVEKSPLRFAAYYPLHFLEYFGCKIFGPSLMTKSAVGKMNNEVTKRVYKGKDFLICGDTHYPELDVKRKFANSGCIDCGNGCFIVVDDGKVELHEEMYFIG